MARDIVADLARAEPHRVVAFEVASGIVVDGDPRLLRAGIEILLLNAWKFTSKRATTQIEFGRSEQYGTCVYFVRDNGAGFDLAHAHELPAALLGHQETTEFGNNIGLATAERIIQRHGGSAWAEAALHEGATFYFTLGDRDRNLPAEQSEQVGQLERLDQ